MNKSYMVIIDRMNAGNFDPSMVGLALAKARPDLFLEIEKACCGQTSVIADDSPPFNIAEMIDDGRTVEAIKRIRELTGVGLREAKDEVDYFRSRGAWNSRMAARIATGTRGVMTADANDALVALCSRLVLADTDADTPLTAPADATFK